MLRYTKLPDLPVEPERQPTNDRAESRSCVGMLNTVWVDMHGVANHMNTDEYMQQRVSRCAEDPKVPDLPIRSTRLCQVDLRATRTH